MSMLPSDNGLALTQGQEVRASQRDAIGRFVSYDYALELL